MRESNAELPMITQPKIHREKNSRVASLLRRSGATAPPPGKVHPSRRLPHEISDQELSPAAADAQPQLAVALGALCLICGTWSYWPTLQSLAATWSRVTDYSHGFLVLPIAVFFLWARRDLRPPLGRPHVLLALALLAIAVVIRGAGDIFFFTFLDG